MRSKASEDENFRFSKFTLLISKWAKELWLSLAPERIVWSGRVVREVAITSLLRDSILSLFDGHGDFFSVFYDNKLSIYKFLINCIVPMWSGAEFTLREVCLLRGMLAEWCTSRGVFPNSMSRVHHSPSTPLDEWGTTPWSSRLGEWGATPACR